MQAFRAGPRGRATHAARRSAPGAEPFLGLYDAAEKRSATLLQSTVFHHASR